jgi:hypothetical protein
MAFGRERNRVSLAGICFKPRNKETKCYSSNSKLKLIMKIIYLQKQF